MGIGIITVSVQAFEDIMRMPRDAAYRVNDIPLDALQAAFLLPDGYDVLGVSVDYMRRVYLVGVRSADIPDVPEGRMAPEVTPTYSRDADGTVRIVKIDISLPHDYSPWHPVPLPVRIDAETTQGVAPTTARVYTWKDFSNH